jgi:hypothetical protein
MHGIAICIEWRTCRRLVVLILILLTKFSSGVTITSGEEKNND